MAGFPGIPDVNLAIRAIDPRFGCSTGLSEWRGHTHVESIFFYVKADDVLLEGLYK